MAQQGYPATGGNHKGKDAPLRPWLENIQGQTDFPNVFREFVHPGKDPREMLMRTVFTDERKVNASVILLHKFARFRMPPEYYQFILDKLAGQTSIGGRSTFMLLQAACQVIAPSLVKDSSKVKSEKKSGDDE